MSQEKNIRAYPLFELYVEGNHLIINNADYVKDNCVLNLNGVLNVELIRHLSIIDKIIEFSFGFYKSSKSNDLRINLRNGFKDIVLTKCNIKRVKSQIYEINQKIISQINKTIPI